MSVRFAVAAIVLSLVVGNAWAETISNDRLCQAIGDSPRISVPPRDRAFFEDKCVCFSGVCAYVGGAKGKALLDALKCAKDVLTKLDGRDQGLAPAFIENSCIATRSAAKTFKLATRELKEKDLATRADRIASCVYAAKVTAQANTAIDYEARCREHPEDWERLMNEARDERDMIARNAEKEAALARVLAQEPAIFDAAFREASINAQERGFVTTCTEYLNDHSTPRTPQHEFVKFCECARGAVPEWNEQARDRCRRAK